MLLDDKKKVVELFIENLLAGTVSGDLISIITSPNADKMDPDGFDELIKDIDKWYNLRKNSDSSDFVKLTNRLFDVLLRGRIFGNIKGVFKEIPALENALTECKDDNRELVRLLKEQGGIIARYEAGMHQQK